MAGIAADKPSVLLLGIGLQLVSPMNGEQALKSGEERQANLDGNRKQTRKVRKRAKKNADLIDGHAKMRFALFRLERSHK